jgi:hypothetical protein
MCWDPGGGQCALWNTKIYGSGQCALWNRKIYGLIADAGADAEEDEQSTAHESRTDLDSHANMPVVGNGAAYILADYNMTCQISPNIPDYEPMRVPMVDAAVKM